VGRLPDSRSLDMPVRDRAKEIWKPLVRIAEAAGGDWPKEAREAAVFFTDANATREANTDGIELLAHIKEAFLEADKIWTSTLRVRSSEETKPAGKRYGSTESEKLGTKAASPISEGLTG
jgi:hypothetical protein